MLVLSAPDSYITYLQPLTKNIDTQPDGQYDFIQFFATRLDDARALCPEVVAAATADAYIWFCYPKGTSRHYRSDIKRDLVWDLLGNYGYEPVTQVPIDEDWSAIRYRPVGQIKKMTRKIAATAEGRSRIEAAAKSKQ